MIIALNPATIGGEPPLLEYISLAEKYGFGGIEFSIEEIVKTAASTSWNQVRNIFEQYGVAPAIFGLPINWRNDDEAFKEGLKDLPRFAQAASEIGCTRTGTWLPPAVNSSADDFRRMASKRFSIIANVLADYNIRLALEFVGPQSCRQGPNSQGAHSFIYTMGQTLDFIDEMEVKADNVGLLVDSFHWYTSRGTVENLMMLTANRVVHVHINDAPDRKIDEQLDFERLLPGDGIIDLKSFLKTLAQIGYVGFAAVETFSDDLIAKGREGAAEQTEAAVERLLSTL